MDGDSTQKPTQPVMCANNCGFFGNPLTSNFCSKCYRDTHKASPPSPSVIQFTTPVVPSSPVTIPSATPTPTPSTTEPIDASSTSQTTPQIATPSENEEDDGKKIQKDTTRCWSCNKKVGLLGFRCRCEYVFCGLHRYSDKHECPFDYKTLGREQLSKANPVVKGSKLDKI
eukprot:TRINITY_DN585_c0_g1_i1.p1 TRINITY_DN585_c0_g1~~TRINITY_DN585_c0_g1_i1.p1  ORF type:complete len:171 (-),score=42.85 TRINITY_DN585_c0_g1_i1:121-633(-)